MAKCSAMLVVLCTLLVLQLVASHPAETTSVALQKDEGAPLGLPLGEHVGKAGDKSSEEEDSAKSDSSSSEEKKDEAHAPE